ncbi:hypothetical protein B0T18DRAFT_392370 [Schizothecium vesticola]|uniref:C2H2-type domain-containing protein n=1 Tax=Schizothecium vesticola TaxID=314040 RepID=A0AA40EQG7_9PEZI|nr:hypothetical protein B0T18DRAFT_392370 [Schizothecium vesticola]
MPSVKDNVLSCLRAFDVLSGTISTVEAGGNGGHHNTLDDSRPQVLSLASVSDQVARFKIWAGNIGAHQKGRSSLDYRLREASHIRAQIIRLLGDLWDALQDATSILRGERTPWDKEPVSQEEFTDAEEGVGEAVNEASTTELGQISGDISEVIDCLFRLSVSIRNPAPHDMFKRSMWTDTAEQAHFYVEHVRERFRDADEDLTSRLGRANAHRRQYFRYREQHHEKLARGIDEAHLATADDAMTDTIASSIPQQMKIDGLTGEANQEPDVIDEDKASTGWTETTVASSLVAGDRDRPRIPPLPKDAAGRPFECPYCYMMISATTTPAWRRHVFADLCPYICLSPDCHTPEETYPNRHEWMQHMLYNHWRTWTCALGCDKCFDSATAAKNHLAEIHSDVSTPEHIEFLAGMHEEVKSRDATVHCPLCQKSNLAIKEYARHVGRHQKDLSLFSLPQLGDDDDNIDLELSQGSEQASEDMEDERDETLYDGNKKGDVPGSKKIPDNDVDLQVDQILSAPGEVHGRSPKPGTQQRESEWERFKGPIIEHIVQDKWLIPRIQRFMKREYGFTARYRA